MLYSTFFLQVFFTGSPFRAPSSAAAAGAAVVDVVEYVAQPFSRECLFSNSPFL